MAKTDDEVLQAAYDWAAEAATYVQALRVIDEGYEGNLRVDLPELRASERVAVANMLVQGVDQHGMRIASVAPDYVTTPLRPTVGTSVQRAELRRRAMLGLLDENAVDVQDHQRARWLIAYAKAPVQILPRRLRRGDPLWTPDNDWTVEWRLRPPHDCFPAPCANPTDMTPPAGVFRYVQTVKWVADTFGVDVADTIRRYRRALVRHPIVGQDDYDKVELVEYVDGEETILMAVGDAGTGRGRIEASYGLATITRIGGIGSGRYWGIRLTQYENRTGLCPLVVPSRITLGKPQGQFDQMVGLFEEQAHLMALELHAVRKNIFPDTWLQSYQNEQAQILVKPDGLAGIVGEVRGGEIKEIRSDSSWQTYPTIDRLSESMRQQALIPPDFGGQSGSNIRTARRGADIIASTVDFSIQEAQLLFQRAKKHEMVRGVETAKAYFGQRRKVYSVGWPGAKGVVDYRPADIFEAGATFTVEYSAVGSDANMLNLTISQSQGTDRMSWATARKLDPLIEDPDFEERQITIEKLIRASIDSIGQQITAGATPGVDVMRMVEMLEGGATYVEAYRAMHAEAQTRQAPDVNPVAPGSPEAQPGVELPGAGAEAAAIPASTPSQEHLTQLLHQVATNRSAASAA